MPLPPLVERARKCLAGGPPGDLNAVLEQLASDCQPADAAPILAQALDHPAWGIRKHAANLLVRLGPECISHLTPLLRGRSDDQVYWSCFVLAQLEGRGAPNLANMLSNPKKHHRYYAINALAHRTSEDAVGLLIMALEDPVWAHRKQAAAILIRRPDKDTVVERLRVDITKGCRDRVYWGVHVLAAILGPKSLPIMMKLLPWKDDDLRYLVIMALAGLKVEGIVPLLVEYLNDVSPLIRNAVAELLGQSKDEAHAPVMGVLQTGSPRTIGSALQALARISRTDFYAEAKRILAGEPGEAKYVVLHTVGEVGGPEAIELLISLFEDAQWVIRKYASQELVRMGPDVLPQLLQAVEKGSEDVQYWSIVTMGKLREPARKHLVEALRSGTRDIRRFAVSALAGNSLPAECVPAIVQLFADEHWPLRKQAAECVRQLGDPALRYLLEPAFSAEDHLSYWSRKAISDVTGAEATHFLTALAQIPAAVRDRVIALLGELPTEQLAKCFTLSRPEAELKIATFIPEQEPPPPATEAVPPVPGTTAVHGVDREARPVLTFLRSLVSSLTRVGGMDVLLRAGARPQVRSVGGLVDVTSVVTGPEEMAQVRRLILGSDSAGPVESPIDRCFELHPFGRCRGRLLPDFDGFRIELRPLGFGPPKLDEIGADIHLEAVLQHTDGLVVLSGGPGSGKTWTAAAVLAAINAARATGIATVESPIEHVAYPRPSLITQIGVPDQFPTISAGLRFACTCEANVIYLVDIPDGDAALLALEEAATCSLVIATVAATGAVDAVRRVMELAMGQNPKAIDLMGAALRSSHYQVLLPRSDGKGLVAAREVLTAVPPVLRTLQSREYENLQDLLDGEASIEGVQSMSASLRDLKARGLIAESIEWERPSTA